MEKIKSAKFGDEDGDLGEAQQLLLNLKNEMISTQSGTCSISLNKKKVNITLLLHFFHEIMLSSFYTVLYSFIQLVCICYAVAMQLLCSYYAFAMQLLCSCYAVGMHLLCSCYAVAMQLLCICYAVIMKLLCSCYAVAMQLLCSCYAVAMQLLCSCYAVAVIKAT